jgi:hypothetical protein
MKENGRNKMPYSAEDIRKYLNGEMSAAEMHAIERAAMEDPLLADAIEGLQETKQVQQKNRLQSDSNELKERLAYRVSTKEKLNKSLFAKWWQVAAAVIILAASGSLLFNFLIKHSAPTQPIAKAQSKAVNSDSTQIKPDKVRAALPIDTIIRKEETAATMPGKRKLQKLDLPQISTSSPDTGKKANDKLNNEVAGSSAPTPNQIAGSGDKATAMANRIRSSAQLNILEGKVIDANQKPIIGASVRLGNQSATKTDSNGLFKLSSRQADKAVQATVTDLGYQPLTTSLKNSYLNVILLHPGPSDINELTNSGFSPRRANNIDKKNFFSEPTDSIQSVRPANGWDEFQKYLDKNKKITTADSAIKGVEIISFVVGKHGSLSSFLFKQSLSAAHDAEAIRLIKQGPGWTNSKGKKIRITINISF